MALRSHAGTVAMGTAEETPEGTAWRDSRDLGRRIIGKMMNHGGASGNRSAHKTPRLSHL
jgi:hypothetical protein